MLRHFTLSSSCALDQADLHVSSTVPIKAPIPICSTIRRYLVVQLSLSALQGFLISSFHVFFFSFSLDMLISPFLSAPLSLTQTWHHLCSSVSSLPCSCIPILSQSSSVKWALDGSSNSPGSPQGRSGGAHDRPPGSSRGVLLWTLQDLHQEPKNGRRHMFLNNKNHLVCVFWHLLRTRGGCICATNRLPPVYSAALFSHSKMFVKQGGLHPEPPLWQLACNQHSENTWFHLAVHLTWEMSVFTRHSQAFQPFEPAAFEWTFSPPYRRPNKA